MNPLCSYRRVSKNLDSSQFPMMVPKFKPKTLCYTFRHKYPRTTYLRDFMDWTQNPVEEATNMYTSPVRPVLPEPPHKLFKPVPPDICPESEKAIRNETFDKQGVREPPEAIHYGYRKFNIDPRQKRLRHPTENVPHTLDTIYREKFISPYESPHLLYTHPPPAEPPPPLIGIVPALLGVKPYPPVQDLSTTKDFLYNPDLDFNSFKHRR